MYLLIAKIVIVALVFWATFWFETSDFKKQLVVKMSEVSAQELDPDNVINTEVQEHQNERLKFHFRGLINHLSTKAERIKQEFPDGIALVEIEHLNPLRKKIERLIKKLEMKDIEKNELGNARFEIYNAYDKAVLALFYVVFNGSSEKKNY